MSDPKWPPQDGPSFVRTDWFANCLLEVVEELRARYRQMDFSTGVSTVFEWFDSKLEADPKFLNAKRFPTVSALRAYVRQAVWNEARRAAREAARRPARPIQGLEPDENPVSPTVGPADLAALAECAERLDPTLREVYAMMTGERDPIVNGDGSRISGVAATLDLSEAEVDELFNGAVQQIVHCLGN